MTAKRRRFQFSTSDCMPGIALVEETYMHKAASDVHPALALAERFMEEDLDFVLDNALDKADDATTATALAIARMWAFAGLSQQDSAMQGDA